MSETERQWVDARVAELEAALREIREGAKTCPTNERSMHETLWHIENIVDRVVGAEELLPTDDPWTIHAEAQATIRAEHTPDNENPT